MLAAVSAARAPGSPGKQGLIRASHGRWLYLKAARLTPPRERARRLWQRGPVVVIGAAGTAGFSPLVIELREVTGRERRIAWLLPRGLSAADIAPDLLIFRYTLGGQVKWIFAKRGVSSGPELTALIPGPGPRPG